MLEGPKRFIEHTPHSSVHAPGMDAEKENEAAKICWQSGHSAGASTEVMSDCVFRYIPVKSADTVYGIVGIRLDHGILDDFDNSLFLALTSQCAMAMEKEFISRKRQEEAAVAREEQLRANLLRSISHDLRTPLTSISGNAGVLLADTGTLDESRRKAICQDIYDDSMWLINLVENLLSITRVEGGAVHLNMETELLEEVIDEAMRHINRHKSGHNIQVTQEGDYILVSMDARLKMCIRDRIQSCNFTDNAKDPGNDNAPQNVSLYIFHHQTTCNQYSNAVSYTHLLLLYLNCIFMCPKIILPLPVITSSAAVSTHSS